MLPYVVSADVASLVQAWCKDKGWRAPDESFFEALSGELCNLLRKPFGSTLRYLSHKEMREYTSKQFTASVAPVVSMDFVYANTPIALHMTRAVVKQGSNFVSAGFVPRAKTAPLTKQAETIARLLGAEREVVLYDDVIFEGNTIAHAIELLAKHGVRVVEVRAAITVGAGKRHLNSVPVFSSVHFDEVTDEVCERDFFPGVTQSGRTLASNTYIGIPYIAPFGDAEGWASIPRAYVPIVSDGCRELTCALYEEIARCNNVQITIADLPRGIYGLHHLRDDTNITAVLNHEALRVST